MDVSHREPDHTRRRRAIVQRHPFRHSDVRSLFINAVSLLPGTVAAGLEGDRIMVHALDVNARVEPALQRLEHRVARLFPAKGEEPA